MAGPKSAYAGGPSGTAPSCCIIASASMNTPVLVAEPIVAHAHDVDEPEVDLPAGRGHAHEGAAVGAGQPDASGDPVAAGEDFLGVLRSPD
jgi:hypothetical protein